MHILRVWFTHIVLFSTSTLFAFSADQPANCTVAGFNWTFNEHGESPCEVAMTLDHVCFPNEVFPDMLDPKNIDENTYDGPDSGWSNKCDCNTVQYSLVQACGVCQGSTTDTWSAWSKNCKQPDTVVGSFPLGIPNGTSIPAWAFLDVTVDNDFIPSKAMAIAGKSSDLTMNPTSTTTSGALSATSTASSPLSSNTGGTAAISSKKSRRSIIIGAILGSLIFVAIVVGFTLAFMRRRQRRQSAKLREDAIPTVYVPSFSPVNIYNPSDPTTFPPSIYGDNARLSPAESMQSTKPPPYQYLPEV